MANDDAAAVNPVAPPVDSAPTVTSASVANDNANPSTSLPEIAEMPWNKPQAIPSLNEMPWNKQGLPESPLLHPLDPFYTSVGNVANSAGLVASQKLIGFMKENNRLPLPTDITSALPKIMYEGASSAIESAEHLETNVGNLFGAFTPQQNKNLTAAGMIDTYPVRDAILAKLKPGHEPTDDEQLQIFSEAALKPFPVVNAAFGGLLAPLTPAFNFAVETAQKDGVSAGNLALANVIMTVGGLAAIHGAGVPKPEITNFIAEHGTAPEVANGARDATPAETMTSEMAKEKAIAAYQKTANLVPESTPPTLDELARQQSPEIYEAGKVTDAEKAATDRQDLLNRHIDNLKDETKPHSDEDIAAKQAQVDDADNARKAKKYKGQLEDMHEENAVHMRDAKSPDIEAARNEIEDLNEKKRDLATSATRRAARGKAEAAAGDTHFTQDDHPISDAEWQQLKDAGKVKIDEDGKEYVRAGDYWSEKTRRTESFKESEDVKAQEGNTENPETHEERETRLINEGRALLNGDKANKPLITAIRTAIDGNTEDGITNAVKWATENGRKDIADHIVENAKRDAEHSQSEAEKGPTLSKDNPKYDEAQKKLDEYAEEQSERHKRLDNLAKITESKEPIISDESLDRQHQAIAEDISKKAQAAGIGKEQAEAGSVLQAKGIYGFFAKIFGVSSEEFYAKHGADFEKVDRDLITKKGEYINGLIRLFGRADITTMMHEGAHHFLILMDKFSKELDAPKTLLDEMKVVRDWLGLKDSDDLSAVHQTGRDKGKFIHTEAHEHFARGFEKYLREGIAPSAGLLPIFSKMKQWFSEIYDAVKKTIGPKTKYKLTDQARAFFDRTLSENPEPHISTEPPSEASASANEMKARNTSPEKAPEVADKIASDIIKTAETHDEGIANAIKSAEVTSSAETPTDNATNATRPEPVTGQANVAEKPTEVATGGNRPTSESVSTNGEPANKSGGDKKPTSLTEPQPTESKYIDKVGNIRLDKLIFSDDFINVIKDLAEQNADFMDDRYGTEAYQQALRIRAVNELLIQLDVETGKVAKEIDDAKTPEAKAKAIAKNVQLMEQITNALKLKNTQSADWAHAGHELQKVTETVKSGSLEQIEAMLQKATGKSLFQLEQEAKAMALLDTPQLRANYAKKMREQKRTPAYAGYITANVLSNVVSHLTYGLSNIITKLTDVPRIAIEAGLSDKTKADRVTLGEIPQYIYGMYSGVQDTLPATWAAIKTGATFMEGGNIGLKVYDAMGHMFGTTKLPKLGVDKVLLDAARREIKENGLTRDDINSRLAMPLRESKSSEGMAEKAKYPNVYKYLEQAAEPMDTKPMVDFQGPVLSKLNPLLSGTQKMLAGLHTFLYSMNFGSEIARTAYRAGITLGLEGDKLQGFIDQYKQNPPIEDLMDAHYKALHDQYMTPTNYKSFMGKVTLMANHNGLTKALFPVVKMPMEIMYQGMVEYSPLSQSSKLATDKINADLRGDNGDIARNAQRAKILTGVGMATMLYGLAYEGMMTPDYSSDPDTRAMQMQQGYVPHALRIGNVYIPLPKYLGRFGVIASMMADFHHIAFDLDPREQDKIGKAISLAIASDITDETYLGTASNMLQAMRDPTHINRYLANEFMSAVVPYGSLQSQINTYTNPYLREARDMIDIVKSRTTGVSRTLPIENDIWGQPLKSGGRNSIKIANDDPLTKWVMSLGVGIAPNPHKIDGVDLNSEQASEYGRIRGQLARQIVAKQLESGLQSHPRQEQFMALQAALKSADHAARGAMLAQYPDLIPKINQSRRDIKTGAKYVTGEDNFESPQKSASSGGE